MAAAKQSVARRVFDEVGHALDDRALQRIWKAQNFSYWMTSMLYGRPDTNPFERKRQLGELNAVVNSRYGSAYLAEAYTGWPNS